MVEPAEKLFLRASRLDEQYRWTGPPLPLDRPAGAGTAGTAGAAGTADRTGARAEGRAGAAAKAQALMVREGAGSKPAKGGAAKAKAKPWNTRAWALKRRLIKVAQEVSAAATFLPASNASSSRRLALARLLPCQLWWRAAVLPK